MSQIEENLQRDLKTAMIAGDKKKTETLRSLKNALQYEKMSAGSPEDALSDEQAQRVLAREAKKRQEAVELYEKAGETERQKQEAYEKEVIDSYLPEQLSEEEIRKTVDEEIEKLDQPTLQDMGKIIGQVRARLGASADGAAVARLTKEALNK